MTTVPVAEARQNFSALVDEAVTTHERIRVTRNGVPAIWMIADEDFESIMETLDILADTVAVVDIARSRTDAEAGRYLTSEETAKILAARGEGINVGDEVEVIADLHARGLPDVVCMAALDAIIDLHRQGGR
jgi:prevent-host-death family protein